MGEHSFLVIETDEQIVRLLSDALFRLNNNGLQVKRVRSLVEGVQSIAHENFDLVFSALTLPDSKDVNTLRELQQVTNTPVVVINNTSSEEERELLLRSGAGEVFNPRESSDDETLSVIRGVIGRNSVLKEKQQRISDLIDANIDHARTLEDLRSANEELAREIAHRREFEAKSTLLSTAIEQLTEGLVITDTDGNVIYVNPAFEKSMGFSKEEMTNLGVQTLIERIVDRQIPLQIENCLRQGKSWRGKVTSRRRDESIVEEELTLTQVRDEAGTPKFIVSVSRDIAKESSLERQLIEAQKLESIGRLAAGIAHEINTPTQYVGDNIRFFRDAFSDFSSFLEANRLIIEKLSHIPEMAETLEAVNELTEKADLEYYLKEVPLALEQALEGVERIAEIVMAMKEFSHPGTDRKQPADINRAIQSTVTVCRNEWKYTAEMELNLEPTLPSIQCHIGELNQVVLNLIVNASHAIQPIREASGVKGKISITTQRASDAVEIRITDTGEGIPEDIMSKIFEPFFTTKEVGKGTGQGLAIAYSTVVDKHNGTIAVESTVGVGTSFLIRLPLSDHL